MPQQTALADDILSYSPAGEVGFQDSYQKLSLILAGTRINHPSGGWHLLIDVREWTGDRTSSELRSISTMIARHKPALSCCCTVVCANDLQYGLGRIFAVYLDGSGIVTQIFPDLPSTTAWLASPN